ncbi:MAG: copper chaperone PCu(A)C [Rhodanobacteraceae bacterium]
MTTFRNLLAVGILAISVAATAAATSPAGVHVEHPWVRWLPANLPTAGYAKIVNDSDSTVRLASASSADYHSVTLMHSRLAQNDSTMVPVPHIDIPAHTSATLAPGGYHLMLSHATHPIKPGDTVSITLHFADGEVLQVGFSVLPANATGPSG